MADNKEETGRQPLPPAKRRRLQLMFEHGNKVAAQGQFDYATQMYSDCVLGDPANPVYVKSFLSNLAKKYQGNKKGSKMAGMATMGARGLLKKASMQKDWANVFTNSLEILKSNPWDTGALIELGKACEAQESRRIANRIHADGARRQYGRRRSQPRGRPRLCADRAV